MISETLLKPDTSQEAAVRALSLLQSYAYMRQGAEVQLSGVEFPPPATEEPSPSITGAYLYGPVGSGKTMCLDLFFRTLPLTEAGPGSHFLRAETIKVAEAAASSLADQQLPAPVTAIPARVRHKRRLHFHEFMLNVHQRLHALQQDRPKVMGRTRMGLPVYR